MKEKDKAASPSNRRKSTGAQTPDGKLRPTRGRISHGMLTRAVVLEGESRERFAELLKTLFDELRPGTCIEELLVQKMAVAQWRQMRLWTMEKVVIDHDGRDAGTGLTKLASAALGSRASNGRLQEFEARMDAQFDRALDRFYKFRAAKCGIFPASSTNEMESEK